MVMILSQQGYPENEYVLSRLDYFLISSPCEGGILIVGKDSNGREYRPKNGQAIRDQFTLPSGLRYDEPVGSDSQKNYPAIFFPFELDSRRWTPKIIDNVLKEEFDDEFFGKFDFRLMDETKGRIELDPKLERFFKEIAVWGAYELTGLVRNHFWGGDVL